MRGLAKWLKKPAKSAGLVGVGFHAEGVSVAHVMRRDDALPRLLACGFQGGGRDEDHEEHLASLIEEHGLCGLPCVAVLEPRHCKLVQVERPQVEPGELLAAVRWKIRELIEFPVEDAIIDLFELPSGNQPGRPALVSVVAVQRSMIERHAEMIERVGLDLQAIDITELVLRNVACLLPENDDGAVIVYLLPHEAVMTVTRNSQLYLARNIESGSWELESALMPGSVVEPESVEPGLDNPLIDRLVLDIQRSLDYYESYFSQPPVSSLVVSPLDQNSSALNQYITGHLGTIARTLDLNTVMESDEYLSDSMQARCLSAIGAALREQDLAA